MTFNLATIQLAQQIQTPALTTFSKFVAVLANPLLLLVIAITISLIIYRNKKKCRAVLISLTVFLTAIIIEVSKVAFGVIRPASEIVYRTTYSFPSGHTMFSVVFFGLMTYLFAKGKYRIPAIIISVLIVLIVSATRLYLRVHWLTDIIGGIGFGIIILSLAILADKSICLNKSKDYNI